MKQTLTLEELPELMDLGEAANQVSMSVQSLRNAIRAGELAAFIPRGREPLRAGPGQGYRITREALASWYLNVPEVQS